MQVLHDAECEQEYLPGVINHVSGLCRCRERDIMEEQFDGDVCKTCGAIVPHSHHALHTEWHNPRLEYKEEGEKLPADEGMRLD